MRYIVLAALGAVACSKAAPAGKVDVQLGISQHQAKLTGPNAIASLEKDADGKLKYIELTILNDKVAPPVCNSELPAKKALGGDNWGLTLSMQEPTPGEESSAHVTIYFLPTKGPWAGTPEALSPFAGANAKLVSLTDRTAVVSFDISGMNDDEFAKGTVEAAVCPTPKS